MPLSEAAAHSTTRTVLLSHRLGHVHGPLMHAFGDLRFETLPPDGSVPEGAHHAEVLFRAGMPHDTLRKTLEQAPKLQWIHTASAGFNWVLIPEVKAGTVRLTRTANVLNTPIAEFVVTLAFALLKRLPQLFIAQREHRWERPNIQSLDGKTVGILGAGAIGTQTARRFRALGMRTLGIKRHPEPLPDFDAVMGPHDLNRLLEDVDILVVACPLTSETRNLIGRRQLERMKPSAVLINIARGEILVEDDLVEALRSGVIAGAGLDVFTVEPLPDDSPLWDLPNVIITPHASYIAPENERGMLEEFIENLRRYLADEPLLNEIKSRELGY